VGGLLLGGLGDGEPARDRFSGVDRTGFRIDSASCAPGTGQRWER